MLAVKSRSLILLLLSMSAVLVALPNSHADNSFTFAFAGDTGQYGISLGTGQNGTASFFNSASSLQALPPGLSFFVDDGDLSYNGTSSGFPPTGNEVLWCNFVKANIQANLGSNFPWIQVVGNHEDGNSQFARDGYIDAFTDPGCLPKPSGIGFIPSTVGCPDASLTTGCYGREGYWDFPANNPLARFIVIAGAEKIGLGNSTTLYNYCPLSACNNPKFDQRWTWLKGVIDQAKAQGEWVIVFNHKPCLSPDITTACEGSGTYNGHNPTAQLWDLFFSEGVDLVINGHAHIHARSKQITCLGPIEPATSSTSHPYFPACVVGDGSNDSYTRGKGVVDIIEGAFSQEDGQLNYTSPDTSYFARAMSARPNPTVTPHSCCWINGSPIDMNSGVGFGSVTISANQLSYGWTTSLIAHFVSDQVPTFTDSFTIKENTSTPSLSAAFGGFLIDHLTLLLVLASAGSVAAALVVRRRRSSGKDASLKQLELLVGTNHAFQMRFEWLCGL